MNTVEFKEGFIRKFAIKTGKMGETIGVITIEVESMDPKKEFAPVMELHNIGANILIVENVKD